MRAKIFEVIADAELGGAPKHVLTLVRGLDKKQFEPVVVCPSGWLARECKQEKIEVINIDFKGFYDFKSVRKLRAKIKKENPDLVHLHGVRVGWLGTLALIGLGKKMIYTEHLYTHSYHLNSRFREFLQIFGLFFANLFAKKIITPSSAVKKFLTDKVLVRSAKITIVPNGLEEFKVKDRDPDMKIGFIGGLNIQKGIPTLVSAMRELSLEFPDLKLEIIGDGPLKNQLERLSADIKSNVKFLGQKEDIADFLTSWKMLVVPSVSESFGQVALESFIASRPVVATSVGGLPEVVLEDATGILTKPADVPDMVHAISFLLHNPKEAERMGRNGRKIYERFFTAKRMVSAIEDIYRKTIGKTNDEHQKTKK